MAEVKTVIEHTIPAWIDVRQHYNVEIIGILQGKLTIPKIEIKEDLLVGSARVEVEGDSSYSFPCKVKIETNKVETDLLFGWLTLEQYYPGYDELYGKLTYEASTASYDLVQGHVKYQLPIDSTLLQGKVRVEKEELKDIECSGNELQGSIHYTKGMKQRDLNGKLTIEKHDGSTSQLLRGSLTYERGESTTDIDAHIAYEEDMKKVELLKAHCYIERNDVVEDLLQGKVSLDIADEKIDLLQGKLTIANFYAAADFPCRIKVNKRELIHSIFARIDVPPTSRVDIPCTIEVDGENCANQVVLQGKVELLKDDVSVDLMDGNVTLLPTIYADIDCHAKMNPIYTRREFDASINVVQHHEMELPATVTVTPPADYWYTQEILYCSIAVGDRYSKYLPSSIDVQGERKIYSTFPRPPKKPMTRIAIVVSPTWRYEASVFKSSLITFLDRYYHKTPLDIIFGGNPRADFDIINLAANYRIPRYNLLRVPIEVDFHNRSKMQASVDHFIRHMIADSNGKPLLLSRVFIFMNQPSWYYSDPVGKIAQFCKDNQISCVAISSGGEYHEMTEIDRARDAALNHIEWDRQNRMHPVYAYENIKSPTTDPRIVY